MIRGSLPPVFTHAYALCHMMSMECLSLTVSLSLLLLLETIFLDLLILFLVSHSFFILIIILLKIFKLKYSFFFNVYLTLLSPRCGMWDLQFLLQPDL